MMTLLFTAFLSISAFAETALQVESSAMIADKNPSSIGQLLVNTKPIALPASALPQYIEDQMKDYPSLNGVQVYFAGGKILGVKTGGLGEDQLHPEGKTLQDQLDSGKFDYCSLQVNLKLDEQSHTYPINLHMNLVRDGVGGELGKYNELAAKKAAIWNTVDSDANEITCRTYRKEDLEKNSVPVRVMREAFGADSVSLTYAP